jgi:Zn-dependent peptidase ImmA (M78 family)
VGHILLGHIGEEGAQLEHEADAFAASLLCPAVAVRYLEHKNGKPLSPNELCAIFPISHEAAKRRAKELASLPPVPPSDSEISLLLALFGRFATENSNSL